MAPGLYELDRQPGNGNIRATGGRIRNADKFGWGDLLSESAYMKPCLLSRTNKHASW